MYLNSVALHLFNLLSELLINRLKYYEIKAVAHS